MRAAFKTAAPFCRCRACCNGLTALPCCNADRATRKKGVTERTNTGIFNKEIASKGEEMKNGDSMVLCFWTSSYNFS